MPICIECQHPVKTLWTKYNTGGGGPGPSSSGHNIRLTVCKNCGRFCDKYVEHDFVVLFIDLVLIKPQPSIIRLGILLLLFDVYLTWARIEKQTAPDPMAPHQSNLGRLARQPIGFQYLFFLILCTLTTVSFHLSIRFLTSSPFSPLSLLQIPSFYPNPYPSPNAVSTALLVSSSTKLFPILMVIWDYDVPAAARSLGWAVVANNVEALKILLDSARWAVGYAVLWTAGLEGVDSAGEIGDWRALMSMVGTGLRMHGVFDRRDGMRPIVSFTSRDMETTKPWIILLAEMTENENAGNANGQQNNTNEKTKVESNRVETRGFGGFALAR
ncbi:hypothetical protein MKZ38_003612 [Zalerion maritima]|uniref:Protein ARV n=1 Tax=Zalerion maritima TaxID=339359 RepID=A0AAD5RMP4_9PEZI|nr:hypothetical protein MKZ38_003612 [Zalerion maritima]